MQIQDPILPRKIAASAKARKAAAPDPLPQVTHQEWTKRIATAWQKGVEAILETGRLLIEAKADLKHGEFEAMVKLKLPFDPGTAQRLMAIARHPVISNTAHAPLLPPSWMTLYELTKLPDDTLLPKIKDGSITPKTQRKEVALLLGRGTKKRTSGHPAESTKAAKRAAVVKPVPVKAVPDVVAVDEELELLREFARWFVSERARVTHDPDDRDAWRVLFGRVKAVLGR